jgi:hypothetical protein
MTSGTRNTYQRAADKATELRTYAQVQAQGRGVYLVPASVAGIFYAVRVDDRGNSRAPAARASSGTRVTTRPPLRCDP